MTKIVENNVAIIVMIALFSVILLSSCGTQYSSCGGVDGGRPSACGQR